MKFLIDENISICIYPELVNKKYDVISIAKTYSGITDIEIFNKAIIENRIIITRDYHFSNPYKFPPDKTKGIVYIRCGNLISNEERDIIIKFINSEIIKNIEGKFVTLYKDKIAIKE